MMKNYIYNIVSRGSGFLVRWLLNVFFSMLLLTSDFGVYTFYMSVAYIITSIALFGFEIFILNKSRSASGLSEINDYLVQTLLVIFIVSIFLIPFSISLFYLVISVSISQLFIVYSKTQDNFSLEAKGSFISICIISMLAMIYFFADSTVSVTVEFTLFIASSLIIITSFPSVVAFYKQNTNSFKKIIVKPSIRTVSYYLERKSYGFHELASVANQHIFVLICALILSYDDLGMYKIGQIYLTPLMLIPASMSQVLLKNLKSDDNKNIFRRVFLLAVALFSCAMIILPLISNYLWKESSDILLSIYILYALTLSVQVVNVYIGSKLTIINCQKQRAKNSIISFVFTALSITVLSTLFGVIGVSVSLLINYILLMGLNYLSYEKYKYLHVRP